MVEQEIKKKPRFKVVPWGSTFIVVDVEDNQKKEGGDDVQRSGKTAHSKGTGEDPS